MEKTSKKISNYSMHVHNIKILILSILFLGSLHGNAQTQYTVAILYHNDFSDWGIYDEDGYMIGRFYSSLHDENTWSWELGDNRGEIERTNNSNSISWRFIGYDRDISARTQWRNDPTEWRLTDGDQNISLKSRYKTRLTEWSDSPSELFHIKTLFLDDPREWIVNDNLQDYHSEWRITLIFLSIYNSIPR